MKKTRGFLQWMEYADWVNGKAQLVHKAEAALKLFYLKLKMVLLILLKLSDQACMAQEPQAGYTPQRQHSQHPQRQPGALKGRSSQEEEGQGEG